MFATGTMSDMRLIVPVSSHGTPFPGLTLPDSICHSHHGESWPCSPLSSLTSCSSPVPQALCTPSNVASTTWRTTVCPLPPKVRQNTRFTANEFAIEGPPTPKTSWPSPVVTPNGHYGPFIYAHAPQHYAMGGIASTVVTQYPEMARTMLPSYSSRSEAHLAVPIRRVEYGGTTSTLVLPGASVAEPVRQPQTERVDHDIVTSPVMKMARH